MNKFEDFIDFLTLKGVKSIHIELQTPERLSRTLETHIGTIGESDTTVVERGTVTHVEPKREPIADTALPRVAQDISDRHDEIAAKKAADKKAADDKAEADRIAAEKVAYDKAEADQIAAEKAEAARIAALEAEKAKQPKAKKEKAAKSETKPEASGTDLPIWEQLAQAKDAAARQKIFSAQKRTAYEIFDEMVTADDGTITPEHRKAVIDCMDRAGLLMVNNTFKLGIDSDIGDDDELRALVAECF